MHLLISMTSSSSFTHSPIPPMPSGKEFELALGEIRSVYFSNQLGLEERSPSHDCNVSAWTNCSDSRCARSIGAREPVRSAFPGAPCGRGLGRTRSSGNRRERVQRGARRSTVEQLHDRSRRKALDYHGSRPVGNHSAFARRVLIEVNAASRRSPPSWSIAGVPRVQRSYFKSAKEKTKYVRNQYVNWLRRPNDWPRRTSPGAHTTSNRNSPPSTASRDRAGADRNSRVSPHRSRAR